MERLRAGEKASGRIYGKLGYGRLDTKDSFR
jgi:hypothetical protein